MKIDRIRIDMLRECMIESGIMFRIEVMCGEKIYNYRQIIPENEFESVFDRCVDYAKENILQLVRKEVK